MAFDYDAFYRETPDALGAPTKAFCDFFADCKDTGLRVLDVGCGQGRDALFIARLGHSVTGVDLSPAGISDLKKVAAREGLAIEAHVADIVIYEPAGAFDVLVVDRTLHMLDSDDQLRVLKRLITHLKPGGYLLIADEPSNLPAFRKALENAAGQWSVIKDKDGLLFVQLLP